MRILVDGYYARMKQEIPMNKITLITQLPKDVYNKLNRMSIIDSVHIDQLLIQLINKEYDGWIEQNWEYEE